MQWGNVKMPHRIAEHLGGILGELLACYLMSLKVLEDLMPFIKRYGYRSFKRKHKRRKRAKQKGQIYGNNSSNATADNTDA